MAVQVTWQLGLALLLLVVLAAVLAQVFRLGLVREVVVASVRAVVQLAVVSGLLVVALTHLFGAVVFVVLMVSVAVWTTTGRVGCRHALGWSALAMLLGVMPVLGIIFLSGAVPLAGAAIVPVCGIIIGNAMTAHTLFGKRSFAIVADQFDLYEAGLALGVRPANILHHLVHPAARAALTPNIDTTRTVGLVTLPGAFVGVLLGGGSAIQAGAAQVLVLFGIMAAMIGTVVAAERFVCSQRIFPLDPGPTGPRSG